MKKTALVRKIRQEFPTLKFKQAVQNFEGWDHDVLILDNKYVFRFPKTSEYLPKLRTEIDLLNYLRPKVRVPIPQYKFIAHDKTFAGYEMLQGIQMERAVFEKLPGSTQLQIIQQLAQFMSTMHRTPWRTAKRFDPDIDSPRKTYRDTEAQIRKLLFPRFSQADQQMIEQFLQELKTCLNFPKRVLIHTDLYPSHILLAPNKKTLSGIIDFADRNLDDPAMDFCELWVYGRKFVEEVYWHYQGPKDKNFLYRSQLYYKRMPLWMMISCCEGRKGNFRQNYQLFRQIFLDKKTFQ